MVSRNMEKRNSKDKYGMRAADARFSERLNNECNPSTPRSETLT